MDEERGGRRFEQRVIDSFDRSRIRREVLKSKAHRLAGLKRRYATLVLGASLAVGGVGIPMTASHMARDLGAAKARNSSGASAAGDMSPDIQADIAAARDIAQQVTGAIAPSPETLGFAPKAPPGSEKLSVITENSRESFFKAEVPFGSLIYKEAKKNDLSPELLAAVVKAESQFKPTARSHAGAQGLMQLKPKTGKWMGAKNLMNPVENVAAGAKYLKYLHERFDGDTTKVIAAYNAGEGNVRKFDGVPPFKETRNYVNRVFSNAKDFREQVAGKLAEDQPAESPVDLR